MCSWKLEKYPHWVNHGGAEQKNWNQTRSLQVFRLLFSSTQRLPSCSSLWHASWNRCRDSRLLERRIYFSLTAGIRPSIRKASHHSNIAQKKYSSSQDPRWKTYDKRMRIWDIDWFMLQLYKRCWYSIVQELWAPQEHHPKIHEFSLYFSDFGSIFSTNLTIYYLNVFL